MQVQWRMRNCSQPWWFWFGLFLASSYPAPPADESAHQCAPSIWCGEKLWLKVLFVCCFLRVVALGKLSICREQAQPAGEALRFKVDSDRLGTAWCVDSPCLLQEHRRLASLNQCLVIGSNYSLPPAFWSIPNAATLPRWPRSLTTKMNFDQILTAIGGFGRYQKILYIWICLPQILLAFHMMVSIFTGATPPFECRESSKPGAWNQTLLPDAVAGNLSLSESESSCFSSSSTSEEEALPLQGNRTERVPCGHGWVYSKEVFQSTTVTEVLRMI